MIQNPVHPFGRGSEPSQLLLEVNRNPAKKNVSPGLHRFFIERQRQVHWEHHRVMPHLDPAPGKRVIPHAHSAVITPGPGRQQDQFHF